MSTATAEQNIIIYFRGGHAKVICCAGSGKTFVLINRNKYLIEIGVPADQILNVMFNSDAVDAFKARLKDSIGKNQVTVTNFNRLGVSLLKTLSKNKLYEPKRLLRTDSQQHAAIRPVLDRFIERGKGYYNALIEFKRFAGLAKATLLPLGEVYRKYEFAKNHLYFIEMFPVYERHRIAEGVCTFDDQIYDVVMTCRSNPDAVKLLSNKYLEIMIDEYQDISECQQQMMVIVAGTSANVMCVGDDDQCIYTWRGADPEYLISKFGRDFKNEKKFSLSKTFRNGHAISLGSAFLIKNNVNRIDKNNISAATAAKTEIIIDKLKPKQDNVPRHVENWIAKGRRINEIAVLVRSFSSTLPVEVSLLEAGIPYHIEGGLKVLEADLIGSMITAFHIMNDTLDDMPENLLVNHAWRFIRMFSTGMSHDEEKELNTRLMAQPRNALVELTGSIQKVGFDWIRNEIKKVCRCWSELSKCTDYQKKDFFESAYKLMNMPALIDRAALDDEQKADMEEIISSFKSFVSHSNLNLSQFCNYIHDISTKETKGDDQLLITSVHRSKGLEWPMVILPGLSHGKFPAFHAKKGITPEQLEDERRLFYVAMTRSQEVLILISPRDPKLEDAMKRGHTSPSMVLAKDENNASIFLYEINAIVAQNIDKIISGELRVDIDKLPKSEIITSYINKVRADMAA